MKKLLVLTAMLVIALSSVVSAQQQEPSVSPRVPESSAKLLLEVSYNPAAPPSYSPVLGRNNKPNQILLGNFVRIPGREMSPPIQAVRLESQYNGETAEIRVTLLRGATGFNQEDLIATYHIGIGEQKTIKELRAAGVEPIKITLLNTVPSLPPPPAFENLTKSIEIISIQVENVPNPAYKIIFRNLSDKTVRALRVDTISDGRTATISFLQNEEGRSLIEPGGTFERYIPATKAQPTATGYEPGTAATNTLVIRSVMFSDTSFEGDPEPACWMESFVMGRRLWLRQVLGLIDRELSAASFEDHIEAARQFKEKFAALRYEFSESERNQSSAVSPGCPKPIERAQALPEGLKLQVLRDLDDIITRRSSLPFNFKTWLEVRRTKYQAWLARL